jgi:flagellar hook-associated protein 2
VDATLVNMGTNDVRLFISSVETGATQDIAVTNVSGSAIDAKISSMTDVQTGVNAKFKFNGGSTEIERSSNQVDDLITGYKITLKELGVSNVNVSQNRENIHAKIDSFVEKYNSAIEELERTTKSSTDSDERGIFSNESIIKGMKSNIENMLKTVGEGAGTLLDYGFDINKDGKMSVNKDVIDTKLNDNTTNFVAFFSGGIYTKEDGSNVDLTGAFDEMSTTIEGFTKYNATLDQYKTTITDSKSNLEDRKALETEKLDAKYEILKKQFIAYDIMISRFNSASSMFSQMISAQNATNN